MPNASAIHETSARSRGSAGGAFWRNARVIVLLVFCGCPVGPNFRRPDAPLKDSWTVKDDPQVVTRPAEEKTPGNPGADQTWWKGFNDPALEKLVELAARQNLQLQMTVYRIAEARAQLGVAVGKQFPLHRIFGRGSGARLSSNAININVGGTHYWDWMVGFDTIWELDVWGKARRGVEAARAGQGAAEAEYADALVSLTAEVARTYVLIRTIEVLLEQAKENVTLQTEGLDIAKSRNKNGATSELDVTQATTLLETTRSSIPQLQSELQRARNALATLLGQSTAGLDALLAGPPEIPKAPESVPISMPAELLRRRPDLRRAELLAASQNARVGVATAELLPSFILFGRIGFEASSLGVSSGAGTSDLGSSLFYGFGLTASWEFFSYGRVQNNIRIEEARLNQLSTGYREAVLTATQEVEDSIAAFINARDALVFDQRSVEAAQQSVRISLVQYREGAVDYQRILDSQRSLLERQNALAETNSNVITSLIALYKALGGGWESRATISSPPGAP